MSSLNTGNPISVEHVLDTLYQAVNRLSDCIDALETLLVAAESKPSPTTATPTTPASARGPRAARSKSAKSKAPDPTSSATKTLAPATIRTISTPDVQEKITVTLSIPDAQAGHLVGCTGTGLRQIHDISCQTFSISHCRLWFTCRHYSRLHP